VNSPFTLHLETIKKHM